MILSITASGVEAKNEDVESNITDLDDSCRARDVKLKTRQHRLCGVWVLKHTAVVCRTAVHNNVQPTQMLHRLLCVLKSTIHVKCRYINT